MCFRLHKVFLQRNIMLSDIEKIISSMAATSACKSGWDKLETTVSQSNIVTLSWPAWKLKIISFKVDKHDYENCNSIEEFSLNIDALDNIYDIFDDFVWRTNRNPAEHEWDKYQKAKVVDLVDAFLAGEWTPPWKCGHCASRMAGKYKPRF